MRVKRLLLVAAPLVFLLWPLGARATFRPVEGRYLVSHSQPIEVCAGEPAQCTVALIEGWFDVRAYETATLLQRFEIAASDVRVVAVDGGEVELPLDEIAFAVHETRDADFGIRSISPGDFAEFGVFSRRYFRSAGEIGSYLRFVGTYESRDDGKTYTLDTSFDRYAAEQPKRVQLLSPTGDYDFHYAFTIEVEWNDASGHSGFGNPVVEDDRSVRVWFFRPDNPELLIKILPACGPFGRYWVFISGLTDLEVEIRVHGPNSSIFDGPPKVYRSQAGEPFQPILDTEGFACS